MFKGQLCEAFAVGRKVGQHQRHRQAVVHELLEEFPGEAAAQPEELGAAVGFIQNQAVDAVSRADQRGNVGQRFDPQPQFRRRSDTGLIVRCPEFFHTSILRH